MNETGAVVAERLRLADTHWTRLKGLLGTTQLDAGTGLWIRPCRRVHTFGMRYALDVVFLDDTARVVGLVRGLEPWRTSPNVQPADSVLELPAGTIDRTGLAMGQSIAIDGWAAAPRSMALDAVVINVLLAGLFVLFAVANLSNALETGSWWRTGPIVVQEGLMGGLFLARRRSSMTSQSVVDWAVAILGTFLPFLLRPTDAPWTQNPLGPPLQVSGLALSILAIATLGRSFGIVAANRGVKAGGLYRFVRHPVYVAHLTGDLGYVLSYPTTPNLIVFALTFVALVVRARVEESLLARDAAYRAYLERVPWRFVPYVY